MPNWCECDLSINSDEKKDFKELKRFKAFAKTKDNVLDTEKFVPYPAKFKKQDKIAEAHHKKTPPDYSVKDGYNNGGYEWCLKNWGTKWGICRPELEEEDFDYGELLYKFESAWNPPIPVIIAMSKMFPTLTFEMRYFEMGCEFNGLLVCEAGKITKQEEGKYFGNRGG